MRAFVLTGGASHGAIQAGMAVALEEHGIVPEMVVGTSVGAINGAWLAGGCPAQGLVDIWMQLTRGDLFPARPLLGLRAFLGRSTYFVPDTALRATLRRHVAFDNLEDAVIPFTVVATDALTGEEVLLDTGSAIDAITASASLPAIYPPAKVQVDGAERLLIDGAIVNNTPITAAVRAGATEVWVLSTGYSGDLVDPPDTALAAGLHAVGLMVQRRFALEMAANTYTVPIHLIPPPTPVMVSPIDFSHSADLIERAHAIASSWLDEGAPQTRGVPSVRTAD